MLFRKIFVKLKNPKQIKDFSRVVLQCNFYNLHCSYGRTLRAVRKKKCWKYFCEMIWKRTGPQSLASASVNELSSVGSNCVKTVLGQYPFPCLFLPVRKTLHSPYRLGELAACLCSHFQECLVLFLSCIVLKTSSRHLHLEMSKLTCLSKQNFRG